MIIANNHCRLQELRDAVNYRATGESGLYRRVWRWHFYAGLICLPFLVLMALTGGLYLYQENIDSLAYRQLRSVEPSSLKQPAARPLDGEALVARAQAAVPGTAVRYVSAPGSDRSAEIGVLTPEGVVSVYVDPTDGRILGSLRDDAKLSEVIKRLHSLEIAGPVGNHWVEIVAGWAIVLVLSGAFLWWRPGRSQSRYGLRGRPTHRIWWRDLHATIGITAAVAILFLAVTGLPWSAFWGQQFGRLTNELGIGVPQYLWGQPQSTPRPDHLSGLPWILTQAPVPVSTSHAGHGASTGIDTTQPQASSIGLNRALEIFRDHGMPEGIPIGLPAGVQGVYTAALLPDDVRQRRVVHLDRYSGEVLADVGYQDFGPAGRIVEWGVSLHTGRQFGWLNQLIMLAACISIVLLAISAIAMWWKRRPQGRLAAPTKQLGDRAAIGALAIAVLLGLFYPLLGASMLAALLIDALIPRRWRERFGL